MAETPKDRWASGSAYEAYTGRWSRLLAPAFLDWLRPPPSAHWLEIGCGTGALTSSICALCEPASVVACDRAEAFVDCVRDVYRMAARPSDEQYRRDVGAYFKSMHLTLNHLLAADRIWMRRLTGTGDAPTALNAIVCDDLPSLTTARQRGDQRLIEFVRGTAEKCWASRSPNPGTS